MKRIIVRYKVKTNETMKNIEYIQSVFNALEERKPEGLRYASFQLEDGVSFIHIASIETEDGSNPLPQFEAFKTFVKDIGDRCEEPPIASEATTVGSYRLF